MSNEPSWKSDIKYLIVLPLLIALLSSLTYLGVQTLRQYGLFIRYIPTVDLEEVHPSYHFTPEALTVLTADFSGTTPQSLLTQVMNKVTRIDQYTASEPLDIYRHVQAGGGLVCEGMARLYHAVLTAHGYEARIVGLKRNLVGSYDTHTTVEVFIDSKWVIYDPTFHVSYQRDGELLGADAIKKAFLDGSFTSITPIFYGEVLYPGRLETYYMNWLPLFNNVLIWEQPKPGFWAKLPPFRYWWSSKFYYEPLSEPQIYRYQFVDRLYFSVSVLLPALCVLLSLFVFGNVVRVILGRHSLLQNQ